MRPSAAMCCLVRVHLGRPCGWGMTGSGPEAQAFQASSRPLEETGTSGLRHEFGTHRPSQGGFPATLGATLRVCLPVMLRCAREPAEGVHVV